MIALTLIDGINDSAEDAMKLAGDYLFIYTYIFIYI
jgi:hypothetical protein